MNIIKIKVALLSLLPVLVQAHSLEPAQAIRYSYDGYTQIRMKAVNRYDKTTRFAVEVFADREKTLPISFKAFPEELTLGPDNERKFMVKIDEAPSILYICTKSIEGRQAGGLIASRICSAVRVVERGVN
mgnify:CR=1 FL=1